VPPRVPGVARLRDGNLRPPAVAGCRSGLRAVVACLRAGARFFAGAAFFAEDDFTAVRTRFAGRGVRPVDAPGAASGAGGFSRNTTRIFPMCCIGCAPTAPHTSAISASRSSRPVSRTRILMSPWLSSVRSISAITLAVSPWLLIITTGSRLWARARNALRSAGVSGDWGGRALDSDMVADRSYGTSKAAGRPRVAHPLASRADPSGLRAEHGGG